MKYDSDCEVPRCSAVSLLLVWSNELLMGGKSHAQDPHSRPHTLVHAMTNTKSKINTQKIGTKTQTLCCVGRLMSIKGTYALTTQPFEQ